MNDTPEVEVIDELPQSVHHTEIKRTVGEKTTLMPFNGSYYEFGYTRAKPGPGEEIGPIVTVDSLKFYLNVADYLGGTQRGLQVDAGVLKGMLFEAFELVGIDTKQIQVEDIEGSELYKVPEGLIDPDQEKKLAELFFNPQDPFNDKLNFDYLQQRLKEMQPGGQAQETEPPQSPEAVVKAAVEPKKK